MALAIPIAGLSALSLTADAFARVVDGTVHGTLTFDGTRSGSLYGDVQTGSQTASGHVVLEFDGAEAQFDPTTGVLERLTNGAGAVGPDYRFDRRYVNPDGYSHSPAPPPFGQCTDTTAYYEAGPVGGIESTWASTTDTGVIRFAFGETSANSTWVAAAEETDESLGCHHGFSASVPQAGVLYGGLGFCWPQDPDRDVFGPEYAGATGLGTPEQRVINGASVDGYALRAILSSTCTYDYSPDTSSVNIDLFFVPGGQDEAPCDGVEFGDVHGSLAILDPPDELESFATDEAACEAVWVPTLEDGFVPQGLDVRSNRTAFVSGYFHPIGQDSDDETGEHCRILQVNLSTGEQMGEEYDFPKNYCKHGGGISIDSTGKAWLADTDELIWLRNGGQLLTDPKARAGDLEGLKASFLVDGAGDTLWIGQWNGEVKKKNKICKFALSDLRKWVKNGTTIRPDPDKCKPTGLKSQGAAFEGSKLWQSLSGAKSGKLKVGSDTYGFGPGSEEIEFDADGCLWAIFEAGTLKWPKKFYPVIARFDPGLIRGTEPNSDCAPA
jgi:hypothetical protein